MDTIKFGNTVRETTEVMTKVAKAMQKKGGIGRTVSRAKFLKIAGFPKAIAVVNNKGRLTAKQTLARQKEIACCSQIAKKTNRFAEKYEIAWHLDNIILGIVSLFSGDAAFKRVKNKAAVKVIASVKTGGRRITGISEAPELSSAMKPKAKRFARKWHGFETFTQKQLEGQMGMNANGIS